MKTRFPKSCHEHLKTRGIRHDNSMTKEDLTMKSGIMKIRTSLFLLEVGLFMLVGVFSDARLAWGQLDVGCALPEGVMEAPVPGITARQAEANPTPENLKSFALEVRNYVQTLTVRSVAYALCIFRRDEGDWKSESVYIIQLAPSGFVAAHSKDMALGGRQLREEVFKAIVVATGLTTTRDPNTGLLREAFANADGGALPEELGGYALGYFPTAGQDSPGILLVGFDLQESHVTPVVHDPADAPAVTASDVVDRETLKAFVEEAVDFFRDKVATEPGNPLVKLRSVFRDEKGPWRDGSVYLYALDTTGYVWFHGAFPQQFEFVVATGQYKDAVTGEAILFKVMEAARENPEGAFIEYHFDDPADDSDSAEIPKVAFVRQHILIPGLEALLPPLIVVAGFYKDNQMALDFAHFANGESFSSEVVLMNLAATPIQPLVYFYGKDGGLIDPGSMVEVMGNLTTTDFGALTLQSELPSLGEVTISTNGMGDLTTGSVKVVTEGLESPIGGVLRFEAPGVGVAGVGASQPARDVIIPVRRQRGGINTGAALRNLSESELMLTCHLMMNGEMIETGTVTLPANGQDARFISELFDHDTSDFTGSMRCTAAGTQTFTGVAVEMDPDNGIFTALPVVPLALDTVSRGDGAAEE